MIRIAFADGCAWRAVYFYYRHSDGLMRKFLHLSIDPSDCYTRPTFSGSVGRWSWRIRLPVVRWKPNAGPVRRVMYSLSSRFWHGMDGRHGWGSKQ